MRIFPACFMVLCTLLAVVVSFHVVAAVLARVCRPAAPQAQPRPGQPGAGGRGLAGEGHQPVPRSSAQDAAAGLLSLVGVRRCGAQTVVYLVACLVKSGHLHQLGCCGSLCFFHWASLCSFSVSSLGNGWGWGERAWLSAWVLWHCWQAAGVAWCCACTALPCSFFLNSSQPCSQQAWRCMRLGVAAACGKVQLSSCCQSTRLPTTHTSAPPIHPYAIFHSPRCSPSLCQPATISSLVLPAMRTSTFVTLSPLQVAGRPPRLELPAAEHIPYSARQRGWGAHPERISVQLHHQDR